MLYPAKQKRKALLFLLTLFIVLGLSACGTNTSSTLKSSKSISNNVPFGKGSDPESGIDSKPRPAPNGHYESIVVANDLAYIGSDNGILYAFGANDGAIHWQHQLSSAVSVFVIANGIVYATTDSTLYALNSSSGALLWHYQVDTTISQLLVVDDVAYINTAAGQNTPALYALDATTGSLRWRYSFNSVTPGLLTVLAGTVYTLQSTGTPGDPNFAQSIYALQANDAHVLWHTPLDRTDGLVNGAVVEANTILYLATSHGALYALRVDTGTLLWHVAQPSGQDFVPGFVSPTIENGIIYIGNMQGVSAFRASDGGRVWQYKLNILGPIPPQPVVVSGVVYTGTTAGQVIALRASDGTQLWQHMSTSVYRPLSVLDGLVVNDTGPIYALRTTDGTQLWQRDAQGSGESSPGGQPEVVSAGVVFMGYDSGSVQAIHVSDGKLLWQYNIPERAVPSNPVYGALITFSNSFTYQQALSIVAELGLKTFADCHPYSWTAQDDKDFFANYHLMTVSAETNSAPLWLIHLRSTPGIERAEAEGAHSCPLEAGNPAAPTYLPAGQSGAYVQLTFSANTSYAAAYAAINALGFRLADPCYEQARSQGRKPTWHSMSQITSFGQTHTLVLATTFFNAITWLTQLKAVPGITKIDTPFKAAC